MRRAGEREAGMDGDLRRPMKVLTAFYDLAVGPVSFDFIPFLIRAEMAREDAGCDRLHVVIVPAQNGVDGMFRDKRNLYDEHEMHWRLWNLVIASCRLVRAHVTLATDWDQANRLATADCFPPAWAHQTLQDKPYLMWPILDAARAGRKIPRLQASEHARRHVRAYFESFGKPVVTITNRNTYEATRNTKDDALALAAAMRENFAVVMVDDTADELARGYGYGGINIDLRMAMYECATMNIVGNNGPAVLLWFSDAPYWHMNAAMPFKHWRKFWEEHIGLDVGAEQQLPWAGRNQTLIYKPMSVESIPR